MDHQPEFSGSVTPSQPERTEQQLRAIHAAMMEELGIGRMDTLPLEDKGYDGYVPPARPTKPRVLINPGIARWHDIEFDDVDESIDQLDSIADGQLYRRRREASSGPTRGLSTRGSHSFSNSVRGTSTRSSHLSSNFPRSSTSARGGRGGRIIRGAGRGARGGEQQATTSSRADLRNTIAMLRDIPRSAPFSKENRPPAPLQNLQPTSSRASVFALADPQDFLKHKGLIPGVGNTTAPMKPLLRQIKSFPETELESDDSKTEKVTPAGRVSMIAPAPVPEYANVGTGGLQNSRWATPLASFVDESSSSISVTTKSEASLGSTPAVPTPTAHVSTLARFSNASPQTPMPNASGEVNYSAAAVDRVILIEKAAKVDKNGMSEILCKVRLVKKIKSLVLEIVISDVLHLKQYLSEGVSFSITDPMTIAFAVGSDMYNIKFSSPHEVSAFETLLPPDLKRPSGPPENPVAFVNSLASSLKRSTLSKAPAMTLDLLEDKMNLLTATMETCKMGFLPTCNVSGSVDHNLLIDVSEERAEEISPVLEGGSALDDLACLNDDPLVEGILAMLNRGVDGSFMDSHRQTAAQELLSTAENLTLRFLRGSSIFEMLPENVKIAYSKHTGKRVLELARFEQSNKLGSRTKSDNLDSEVLPSVSAEVKQQSPIQVDECAETFSETRNSKTDPALSSGLLSAGGQDKTSALQPKNGNHHFSNSLDLGRPTQKFSDLKIETGFEIESSHLSKQQRAILETSNSKEDMARANIEGLSASRWSSSPPRDFQAQRGVNHCQNSGFPPPANVFDSRPTALNFQSALSLTASSLPADLSRREVQATVQNLLTHSLKTRREKQDK